jgi:hypothetical protein
MKAITKADIAAIVLLSATFAASACSREESAAPPASPGSEPSVVAQRTTTASPDSQLLQPGSAGAAASGTAARTPAPAAGRITVLRRLGSLRTRGTKLARGANLFSIRDGAGRPLLVQRAVSTEQEALSQPQASA